MPDPRIRPRIRHVSARLNRWGDALAHAWSPAARVAINGFLVWCDGHGADPRDHESAGRFLAAQSERLAPETVAQQRRDLARLLERGGFAAGAARLRGRGIETVTSRKLGVAGARDRLALALLAVGLTPGDVARLAVADVAAGADLVTIRCGRREIAAPAAGELGEALAGWFAESDISSGALIRDVRGGYVRPSGLSVSAIWRIAKRCTAG